MLQKFNSMSSCFSNGKIKKTDKQNFSKWESTNKAFFCDKYLGMYPQIKYSRH